MPGGIAARGDLPTWSGGDPEGGQQTPSRSGVHPRENGSVAETVTYLNGVKDGVTRRYDEDGQVVGGALFVNDALAAEGVTTEQGKREGPWKEFWPDGSLKSEGSYTNGLKEGNGCFIEFQGEGTGRECTSTMTCMAPGHGGIRVAPFTGKKSYSKGNPDGVFLELDSAGETLVSGQHVAGEREGFWRVHVNDHVEEGIVFGRPKTRQVDPHLRFRKTAI